MKIYREGREIYEIKDYKQIGKFMEVATIEATIKSALPIDIQVGDYVIFDYNNLKYTLYDVYPAKKQARSSTYGEAFVYDLKFKADTEHLSICPFLDLVPNDNNLTYSSLPSFSTFENVYGIADRLQANLDYLYPNQWRFDVVETTDVELLETLSDAREFAISGESCLEGLRKIYDIWGVGFIHSVEDGVNVITIGKSAGKTSLFRYGKGRGLRTIKKNLQNSDQLCTRAYVFGSTRNIPARWYNNKGYIGEAQYAPNLMIPPSKWADGIPQGAYIDAIFDGVNRIEKYGLKIKTLSYDGSDSKKDEIYPSVEKMTAKIIRDAKAEIGENIYIPSPTLYPDNERMDMVLEGSNIADDGTNSEPGYVLHSDKIIKSIEGESETITIAEKKGESKYELDRSIQRNINICVFDIEKPANYRIRERLDFVTFKKNDLESTISAILTLQTPSGEYIELRKLAFTDKLEDSLQIPDSVHELKEAGKYTLILKLGVTWTTDWVVPQIGEDVYLTYNIAETNITLSRGERILDNFFTIKIKQIGFDINDYTASSGAFKNIHFRSGMCSGMSFNIAKCNYIEEIDAWELKCRRVEDSSISQRFPNSIFNIAKDDRFVLLDINMPDLYVYTAMQRLYDTALEDLKHFSTPQYVIEPQIDNIQMARSPQVLKEGMYMAIDDLDIAILNEEALIDSVTITNRGTALRSFEVTLRNDKVYNRYNKLADRIADLESAAQKTASNSTITPVQDTSESKIETPAVGFDENALADYLEENKYTTEGDVTNLLSPIDKEVSTLRTDFDNLNTLLNGNVGGVIDTWNEVVDFLDGYKDSEDLATILSGMNADIANRVLYEDFEKLEEAVSPLFSYFDASGSANNALKLGGQLPSYYATVDALNLVKKDVTAVSNRVQKFEDVIGIDSNGDVYIKGMRNFYTERGTIGMAGLGSGGSGGGGGTAGLGSVTVRVNGEDYITDASGIVTIPDYPSLAGYAKLTDIPTSLPASDVYAWAKKATLAVSDVPDLSGKYLPLSGGTIANSVLAFPLIIKGKESQVGIILKDIKDTNKAAISWEPGTGTYINNYPSGKYISIKDDGTPTYSGSNTLIHSGNIGSYNAGSADVLVSEYLSNVNNATANRLFSSGFQAANRPSDNYVTGLTIYNTELKYLYQLGFSTEGKLFTRYKSSGYQPWKEIAFTDSNVASATKLQTARTIWGQSFDGTGNVDGVFTIGGSGHTTFNTSLSSNYLLIGLDESGNTTDFGIGWRNRNERSVVIKANGNILMGPTNDNGAKLQVNGGITATSVKIGSATLSWDEANKALKINSNIYSDGTIAIGELGEGGSGTGGATGIVTIRVNGADYTSSNGIVTLPNYPTVPTSLKSPHALTFGSKTYDGSAAKTILASDLGALTAHQDISHLLSKTDAANTYQTKITSTNKIPYSNVSGTPVLASVATSGKYSDLSGTPTSLPASDVYSWAKAATKPSYTASEVGALSTSGGTIKGAGAELLTINRTNGNPLIEFQNNGSFVGYIGVNTSGSPIFADSNGSYNIIHSGNIGSQSVNYASSAGMLARGTFSDANAVTYTDRALRWFSGISSSATNVPTVTGSQNGLLALPLHSNGVTAQLYFSATKKLYYRSLQTYDWNEIAYVTDNVASATKLQRARTIWGQSFDGTGNVDGVFTIGGSGHTTFNTSLSSNYLLIGLDESGNTTDFGIGWRNRNERSVVIKANGNILMGPTNDNGAKLQVNGSITAEDTIAMARLASSSDRKLKDNIADVSAEQSMGIIRQLRPTTWDWKKDGKKSYGLIAQEVAPIVPEMVVDMGHLHLEYNQLHAFEIGAIKYIDSEVEILKRRVNELENELKQYRRA